MMKVSKRDTGLILGLVGILVLFFSYEFVFVRSNDKRRQAEAQLTTLKETETKLKNLEDNMDFYKDEIVRIGDLNHDTEKHFPRNILPEDEIIYATQLEENAEIYFGELSYGSPELIVTGYEEATGINAYEVIFSLSYESTYKGLKDAINYNNAENNRMVIDTVSASFDSSTGNLEGTMGINMYYIDGSGNTYTSPYVPDIKTGVSNIFGTFENTK